MGRRPDWEADFVRTFRDARVLTLEDLRHRFSISRATAFRWLGEHGYFSSYNHRGRYFTIEEVARFDSRGLFCFGDACFSRYGTLKDTVAHFVADSTAGMTHEELSELLGVRVHNALLELVNEGAISRERIGPVFLYTSAEKEKGADQVRVRMASGASDFEPTSRQIIAVLLELVRDAEASREEIAARCQRSGVQLGRATVDAVFTLYDLEKKRAL